MAAAYQKQVSVAALLIEKGAAVDAGAENGTTALKAAVFEGQPEIVAMLLKSGANPDFDAGFPPSPRSMSRSKDPVIQAMFANKTP
jgi:ankyrin repeat protein